MTEDRFDKIAKELIHDLAFATNMKCIPNYIVNPQYHFRKKALSLLYEKFDIDAAWVKKEGYEEGQMVHPYGYKKINLKDFVTLGSNIEIGWEVDTPSDAKRIQSSPRRLAMANCKKLGIHWVAIGKNTEGPTAHRRNIKYSIDAAKECHIKMISIDDIDFWNMWQRYLNRKPEKLCNFYLDVIKKNKSIKNTIIDTWQWSLANTEVQEYTKRDIQEFIDQMKKIES